MAKYIEQFTLDISGKRNNSKIFAKQGDRNKRFLKITLVDEETVICLDDDEKVEFRCLKPDKTVAYLAATKEPDGTIMVKLDHQVLTVAGTVRADVAIIDSEENVLSTTNFYIIVEPSSTNGRYIPSTSYRRLDMEMDMDFHSIRNLPEPTEDGDATSKFYVDEQIKENALTVDNKVTKGSSNPVSSEAVIEYVKSEEKTVDSALDENSENAIQNAVVAKEILKAKKIWYTLPVEKFKEKPWELTFKIAKKTENDGQPIYMAVLGFNLYIAKGEGADANLIALTDIPFEFNNDRDKYSLDWTNKEKFPTIGVISSQMGAEPVDLYKQIGAMVDGSTFYNVQMVMNASGYTVGYYDASFVVSISSRIEVAIDTLIEELSQIIPTITHCCIAYEDYAVIEAKGTEVEK